MCNSLQSKPAETAMIRLGLHSIAPGPHYLQLHGHSATGHPVLLLECPVFVRYTCFMQGGEDARLHGRFIRSQEVRDPKTCTLSLYSSVRLVWFVSD